MFASTAFKLPRLAALAAVALAMVPAASGHGYMETPQARNVVNWKAGSFYDPQSGNGAGPSVVFNPNPGICGDPYQGVNPATNFANSPGAVTGTYTAGQTIDVKWTLTANHGGKIVMKLCPDAPASTSQSCFNNNVLKRADNGATGYWITTGSYSGSAPVALQYKLPSGVSCPNGCTLQWEYIAMQSCVEDCAASVCGDEYARKSNPITGGSNLAACPVAKGPEIFRNCADIKIGGGGTAPAPTPGGTAPTPPSGGTCVDLSPAECNAWGAVSCIFTGVPEKCPNMCGKCPGTTSPPPPSGGTGCVDLSPPECNAWGASSCIYPGVPEKCPSMCKKC